MSTTKAFSLYLGKPIVGSLEELLTDSAKELIAQGRASGENQTEESPPA
jgi:hypothetical protein